MLAQVARAPEGRGACAHLTSAYDRVVSTLWRRALEQVAPAARAQLALVATGGWGRCEVCPGSDIDFVLLAPDPEATEIKRFADALLYPMWDSGFKVGHAVRTPEGAAQLAREDLATGTALLDARLVAGDRSVVHALERATRQALAPDGNANGFVAELRHAMERRRERYGGSLYLLEPNIKHGIGGLRDLATGMWAAKARWRVGSLEDLAQSGQLPPRRVAMMSDALDFLLALRTLVQGRRRRAGDQLTFEIQEDIGPALYPDATLPMGDIRPAVAPAVETLMQKYYRHARTTSQACDRLLELCWRPTQPVRRVRTIDRVFAIENGALTARDNEALRARPAELLRAFRLAQEHRVPIAGRTKESIAENSAQLDAQLSRDSECARLYCQALVDVRDDYQPSLLEQMHELGLLNAMMPEFRPCTSRVQHDLYHVYTVDRHQLYTVAMLKSLARGERAIEFPVATRVYPLVQRPMALYLGALLHDVGKPHGKGHARTGADIARVVATRLGMTEDDIATAEFLVLQHLTMPHVSQRRDIADPEVIARFALRIGTRERLHQLYLLSICDTAMTAPGNLSAWKHQLMRELYQRADDYLQGDAGQTPPLEGAEGGSPRARLIERLTTTGATSDAAVAATGVGPSGRVAETWTRAQTEDFVAGIDERFFGQLSTRQLARLVRLARRQQTAGRPVDLSVAYHPLKGHSELAVVADDTRGLLAAIAGALNANRIEVLGAVIGPRNDTVGGRPIALDLFFVRDGYGRAIPVDDPRWQRFRDDLTELITAGEPDLATGSAQGSAGPSEPRAIDSRAVADLLARRRPRSGLQPKVTPGVGTAIAIHNDVSSEATVIEVFTHDRVGVLYAITHTLTEFGLDIHLSKITTEGEKIADVFYVTVGRERAKLDEPVAVARLRQQLYAALEQVPL